MKPQLGGQLQGDISTDCTLQIEAGLGDSPHASSISVTEGTGHRACRSFERGGTDLEAGSASPDETKNMANKTFRTDALLISKRGKQRCPSRGGGGGGGGLRLVHTGNS